VAKPAQFRAGLPVAFNFQVHNSSRRAWPGFDVQREGLVALRYTFTPTSSPSRAKTKLARLGVDLKPGTTTTALVDLTAPNISGAATLCLDLVQQLGERVLPLDVPALEMTVHVAPLVDPSGLAALVASYMIEGEGPPACGTQ